MPNNGKPRRAITLGGGGPAAGLHIGVLDALANANITFDVWSLSCIGAWVGIVYWVLSLVGDTAPGLFPDRAPGLWIAVLGTVTLSRAAYDIGREPGLR